MTGVFEAERRRLFAIAYRLLGSVAEAEDVLQDAWLAWDRAADESIRDPAAYLTTIVTRRCIDILRSARVQRESYIGPWLPEPLVDPAPDASEGVMLAESVRMAFLVVLESLSPAQRAAFVLRDVFGFDYREVARILGRGEPACRQLVARARAEVRARRPRFAADDAAAAAVSERFLSACATGDMGALLATLHTSAVLVSDGGGKATAARRVIDGQSPVARFLVGVTRRYRRAHLRPAIVNGSPGVIVTVGTEVSAVVSWDIEDAAVRRIHIVRNPDKLQHLAPPGWQAPWGVSTEPDIGRSADTPPGDQSARKG